MGDGCDAISTPAITPAGDYVRPSILGAVPVGEGSEGGGMVDGVDEDWIILAW